MSRKNECLECVLNELVKGGIDFEVRRTGSGHLKVQWLVIEHRKRTLIVPSTASDWRAMLNARAHVRRILREDGKVNSCK
jgi:hypothetical protein